MGGTLDTEIHEKPGKSEEFKGIAGGARIAGCRSFRSKRILRPRSVSSPEYAQTRLNPDDRANYKLLRTGVIFEW